MPLRIVGTASVNTEQCMNEEIILQREAIFKTCHSVMDAMKNGLPEKAHSIEVFEYILQETRSMLRTAPLKL